MMASGLGDMSHRLALQRQGAGLKRSIATLSQEMTTGLVKDKSDRVKGDFATLATINNALHMATARKDTARSAGMVFAAQQAILDDLGAQAQSGFLEEFKRGAAPSQSALAWGTRLMEDGFRHAVAQLNTSLGGRALFAGTATDGAAVMAADDMLEAIFQDMMAAYPAGPDPDTAHEFIAAWFAVGGPFDISGYLGGPQIPAKLDLGHGITVGFEMTAQDPAFRQVLGAFATGAILSKGVFVADQPAQQALLAHASQGLGAAHHSLIDLSARLGAAEARASAGLARAEAEHTAMSIARVEMLEANPYETAMQLEQAMTQLDLIYNLTARLSRLSLANYLR